MARILAYTSPARGHLYPAAAILTELRRRGHRISLRTLAGEVETMTRLGFDAAAIEPALESMAHDDYLARNVRDALGHTVRVFCERAKVDAADLRRAIESDRPDAVLVDVNAWGAVAAAEAWGGPWATLYPYPMALTSRDAPPFGPGLAPARGPLGRLRDRILRPLVLGTLERSLLPPINALRADLDLAPLRDADDMFARPPLVLYLTAEPFEYPRWDWPPNIALVGPCEWEPSAAPPGWLDGIDRPLVVVTTSSEFQDDRRLVDAALAALADEPVYVVATVPAGEPGDWPVPGNAHVERFLPHGPLLDRAVCAVTHGGMGATQKALARGVPVCAVPFGRDQFEVARRVEQAGAGTRLPARRLTPHRLRAAVRTAISRAEGARGVAAAFRAAGGPHAAADAVERHLLLSV